MYKSLNSPSNLKGWTSNGGDPCDSWDGITCKGSSITEIRLSGLGLSGSLGYQLSNMKSITYLDVSKNNLNGNLPYQLPLSLDYLDLSENDFNGNIPYSISLMNSLTYLNIAHNQLNGELSDAFQKLPNLETFDLSSNQLTGKLPESFANLTSLKTLHLQDNRFKGSINVLRDLPLDDLNVANNEFSGWIPNELKGIGKLQTEGNQWLTMAAPPPPPGTQYRERDSGGSKNVGIGVIVTAACLGFLVLTAIIIALISRKKHAPSSHFMDEEKDGSHHGRTMYTPESSQMLHYDAIDSFKGLKAIDYDDSTEMKASFKRTSSVRFKNSPTLHMITPEGSTIGSHTSPDQMLPSSPIECFSISDLQNATMGFSPSRFLGEGTIGRVYKAKYLHGRILAVKEIDSSLLGKGNPEEFSSLVSNISRIHHPNVAELIGYCSEKGHNLLIYEYFTSGSLHRFLHLSDDFSNPLTWNTRIRIALGTARAIEYLHEVCSPPLVHKNIKSSNILLDNELNPHLSDYGMANFHHRTSQNLGVGYNAPECTDPSAYTLKSDIYSFGVVMLELLSGRTPYDSNRAKPEQSLVHWARPRLQEMEAIDQMADPALCGLYSPASVSKFSEIVSLCVQMEPELRPQISEVVEALKKLV